MIETSQFFEALSKQGVTFYAGVPDSLLKDFCAYAADKLPAEKHLITANEGAAVGLAAGYHLATGDVPIVYMQNSGLGNSVNPLLSLADPEVYSIPMLLLLGWRGEPGKKDEPQHVKQGRVMLPMLQAMEIPHAVLGQTLESANAAVAQGLAWVKERKGPFALVAQEGCFSPYSMKDAAAPTYPLVREGAIQAFVDALAEDDVVVSTTGKTSRELFEYRKKKNQGHGNDFLTVGSMGHSSQIALGIALEKTERQVFCLDGDGAILMHMGSVAIIGTSGARTFKHVILNNGAHDSVGGQPTVGFQIQLTKIFEACGYKCLGQVQTTAEIRDAVKKLKNTEGPAMLEIRVNKGARKDLGRPTQSTHQNKADFMELLSEEC